VRFESRGRVSYRRAHGAPAHTPSGIVEGPGPATSEMAYGRRATAAQAAGTPVP
jgi:hypothetical protein